MKLQHLYFLLLLFICYTTQLFAQSREPDKRIRLIIRGDDMGCSHAVNEACLASYGQGIMRSVEVMAPTPWFPEAARMLRENPGLDAGIHLTLTSEWTNLKWRPLTPSPSLTDKEGYFYPMIWPNDHYGPEQALSQQPWKLSEIERELRAQIELAVQQIPQVSHLTAHMGCTGMDEKIKALVEKLAQEYKLAIFPEAMGVQQVSYQGPHQTAGEKVASFVKMLESLTPGTYYFLDHPAYDTPEVRAIFHTGYEAVAADRQGVTDLFTSPKVRNIIRKKGIELISYADLVKKP